MCGAVPFRPANLAWGHSGPPPEVPREMALVRKTSRQGYFRQRSMCLPQHVFHLFQAPPQQIRVRRHPYRLVECPRKMVSRKARQGGQSIEANLFIEMPFDIVADAACDGWRQPATARSWNCFHWQIFKRAQSRARMDRGVFGVAQFFGRSEGRRD